jgi:hypothetical protein
VENPKGDARIAPISAQTFNFFLNGSLNGPNLSYASIDWCWDRFVEIDRFWDSSCECHAIHAFGAVKFQEAGRFVRGCAGSQDIVQEEKGPAQDLRVALDSEGAINIDRAFALTQGSLARDRTMPDQKRSVDG